MSISQKSFGTYKEKDITLFTLENKNGMVVKVMNYGATITSITIPGVHEKTVSIACGFDTFEAYFSEEYQANSPYFGCTVGRYCSQIKDAKFSLDGKEFQLAKNCGENNLHGGVVGFDKKRWDAEILEAENAILFTLRSKDMEEGFPGNVQASVKMKLSNNNEIILDYGATTDKATPFSMTNHTYWNLSGFKQSVEDCKVKVNAEKLMTADESGAATGVKNVSGTKNDLREGQVIKDVHEANGDGFEHFYIFDNDQQNLNPVAEVEDTNTGRKLEVFSTEPCMLFYTAKYMSDALQRNKQEKYGKYRAFACETHRWQNGPNLPDSPKTFLHPGENFSSTTIFKLKW